VTVPAAIAGELVSATFVPGADTITVNFDSQTTGALNGTYTRDRSYDVADYVGYTSQATTSNRITVALVSRSGDAGGIIGLNGQFRDYYGGGSFERTGALDLPTAGVGATANYSGRYTGLLNAGAAVSGPGGSLDPLQPIQTTGRYLITADFGRNELSGGIDERQAVGVPTIVLQAVSLGTTAISRTDGSFGGVVGVLDPASGSYADAGTYAGLFAGAGSRDIAALLVFNPVSGSSDLFEHGLIVGSSCAAVGCPACAP